jgi:hypothetical protein
MQETLLSSLNFILAYLFCGQWAAAVSLSLSLNKTLPRVEKRVGCKLWPAFEGQLLNPDAELSLA